MGFWTSSDGVTFSYIFFYFISYGKMMGCALFSPFWVSFLSWYQSYKSLNLISRTCIWLVKSWTGSYGWTFENIYFLKIFQARTFPYIACLLFFSTVDIVCRLSDMWNSANIFFTFFFTAEMYGNLKHSYFFTWFCIHCDIFLTI